MKRFNLNQLKQRKIPLISVIVLFALVLGVAIGQILYSNQTSQTISVYGVDGQFSTSIDTALQGVAYKGDTRGTIVQIDRINDELESNWAIYVSFNNTVTNDILPTHVTCQSTLYEADKTTVIVATTPTIFTQNGTSMYSRLGAFTDWSSFVTINNTIYLDLSFVFTALSSDGDVEVIVWIADWI